MAGHSTPSQVAKLLDISADTVRRYADQFSAHLSQTASPGHGRPRSFDADDVAILAHIIALRRENLSVEDVEERLAAGVAIPSHPAMAEPSQPSQASIIVPAIPEELTAALTRLASLSDVPERLARLEARQDNGRLHWLLLGILLGVLLTLAGAAIYSAIAA